MHGNKNPLILAVLGLAAVSCAGGRQTPEGIPPANVRPQEASRGDRRVVCTQHHKGTITTVIAVNAGHSLRATPAGRVALAGGDPNQPYTVLSEASMDALIETLDAQGMSAYARPFGSGDERWLGRQGDPDVRGAIIVEDNGVRRILVGRKAGSDPALVGAYEAFARAKAAATLWPSSRTEIPAATHVLQ